MIQRPATGPRRRDRHVGLLAALVLMGSARAALAQAPAPTEPAVPGLFPRVAFHLNAEHLSGDDARFSWDTNFGGELDLVDYGRGRLTFVANYQAVLGHEFRDFDPSQGNYVLEGLASYRLPRAEVAFVVHHTSRHLSDRAKRDAVDWNSVGGQIRHVFTRPSFRVDTEGRVLGVLLNSYVDYAMHVDGSVRFTRPLRPGVTALAAAGVRVIAVNGERDRGTQTGARGEGGVRLNGEAGAVELFVAAERRVDAHPLDLLPKRWITLGFRLLSR